jgi:hypothetical protein
MMTFSVSEPDFQTILSLLVQRQRRVIVGSMSFGSVEAVFIGAKRNHWLFLRSQW